MPELRKVSGGFDPDRGNWVHRGLDLSKPTEISQEEIDGFRGHYATQFGLPLDGLDWWLDENPEVLKRYRLYCSLTLRVETAVMGCGTLRSDESRVGKGCVSPCRSRWQPHP